MCTGSSIAFIQHSAPVASMHQNGQRRGSIPPCVFQNRAKLALIDELWFPSLETRRIPCNYFVLKNEDDTAAVGSLCFKRKLHDVVLTQRQSLTIASLKYCAPRVRKSVQSRSSTLCLSAAFSQRHGQLGAKQPLRPFDPRYSTISPLGRRVREIDGQIVGFS